MAKQTDRFIGKAIRYPGALTRDVGGPPHEHLARVRWLAEHGTPEQQARARFYLQVLRPAAANRKKRR